MALMRRLRLPHITAIAILCLIVAAVVVVIGWYEVELRPAAARAQSQLFIIEEGQGAPVIGHNLQAAHLIRSKDAFITYLGLHGLRTKLKAGVFRLIATETTAKIAQTLTANGPSAHELMVIPGDTIAQIEDLAAKEGISTNSFEAALAAPHTEAILSTKPSTVSLEGYLYPDTYDLSNVTADQLVDTMIINLATHLTPQIQQAWAAEGLNVHQGLTLSSVVEKEVANSTDRTKVAQVFLSRLKLGMPLGSDVTAAYASTLAGLPFNVSINSPYNTLLATGLPPGPICSPSLDAMEAVAHPAATNYLYFLAGNDGKTYYAQTYAEHQANIAKYLQQ